MSTRVFYHPTGTEVDLARAPTSLYEQIASWRGQITRDMSPVLTCLGNAEPMYVYRHHDGRFYVRHFPGDAADGHTHPAMTRMSDGHKRQAEYLMRAAERAGLDAQPEHSTGNGTRLDVAVTGGTYNVGLEVQRSALSKLSAVTRTRKSREAGYAVAWINDRPEDQKPEWSDAVPTSRLTARGWDHQMPPLGTAEAYVGRFTPARQGLGWTLDRQPARGTLDRLVERGSAGGFMSVEVVKRGTVTLAVDDGDGLRDDIRAGRFPGYRLWVPPERTRERKTEPQRYSRGCHGDAAPRCVCGAPYLSPISEARGLCEKCRLAEIRGVAA